MTETWLTDFVCDGEILPYGYVLYRKDRPLRGGGVLVAVKESLYSCIISSPSDLEIVTVKIGQGNDSVISCVYVPPESPLSYVSSLVNFLSDLVSAFSKCTFVGDFNFPHIDWLTLTGVSITSICFCDFVFDCNLTQHILEPTHVKGNILDLVLTTPNVVVNCLTIHPQSVFHLSDHFAISFELPCKISSSAAFKPHYVHNFCKADYESITSFLLDFDFSVIFNSLDIEFIWFVIKSSVYEAMSLFVPKVLVKHRNGPKWFDSDIRHHLKCLRTLRRKFRSQPTPQRKKKIDFMENLLQEKLSFAKATYENKLIESRILSNSPAVFSYIRSVSNQNSLPSSVNLDDTLASSDVDKASLFNSYFYSVFVRSSYQLPPVGNLERPSSYLSEVSFTELDVFRALRSLDPSKAMGCDGISPKLLKNCALALYQPLHHLFSLTLLQNYLPSEWRTHLIKPVFKSGDRNSVRNYRPISLLCVVSKVLERLVYDCIVVFVRNSISVHQFGFLQGRSTLQQLLVFFNTIFHSGFQTDAIYLDFRKAFDSVAHKELLHKLWNFGITDNLWLWMKAYLTGRQQCVSVGQSVSNHLPVVSGVPQGSILGPLLFLIFINDLPTSVLSSMVLLYADDTKCVLPISSLSDCLRLQNDLTRLSEWCATWNLALNEEKCCIVHFTGSTRRPCTTSDYCLNEKVISSKTQNKDLGLIVSGDLSWRPHYQFITSRAYKMLGLLRRVFSNSMAVSAKRSLYVSLVRSQLLYCSPIWHPYLLTDVKSLELVQRRATKFIMNNSILDYRNRLIHLNLLPLMMELELADIIFLSSQSKPHLITLIY